MGSEGERESERMRGTGGSTFTTALFRHALSSATPYVIMLPSLASHTLRRKRGRIWSRCNHRVVTNEICALHRLHPLSWSSDYVTMCLADVSILLSNDAV